MLLYLGFDEKVVSLTKKRLLMCLYKISCNLAINMSIASHIEPFLSQILLKTLPKDFLFYQIE